MCIRDSLNPALYIREYIIAITFYKTIQILTEGNRFSVKYYIVYTRHAFLFKRSADELKHYTFRAFDMFKKVKHALTHLMLFRNRLFKYQFSIRVRLLWSRLNWPPFICNNIGKADVKKIYMKEKRSDLRCATYTQKLFNQRPLIIAPLDIPA